MLSCLKAVCLMFFRTLMIGGWMFSLKSSRWLTVASIPKSICNNQGSWGCSKWPNFIRTTSNVLSTLKKYYKDAIRYRSLMRSWLLLFAKRHQAIPWCHKAWLYFLCWQMARTRTIKLWGIKARLGIFLETNIKILKDLNDRRQLPLKFLQWNDITQICFFLQFLNFGRNILWKHNDMKFNIRLRWG